MAWRIAESVVRGEIDNRLPGIISGILYLDGLREPVTLELEGNCEPDLAGRRLTFRNLLPVAKEGLEGLERIQCGEAGTLTANRMSRIPTISQEELDKCIQERKAIPTRWSESLYLEWFSANGRVLIEGSSFACQLTPARWKLSEEAYQWSRHLKERRACLVFDETETSETEDPEESTDEPSGSKRPFALRMTAVNGLKPHPLVKRVSKRFYVDEAIENQPLEGMIEATGRASIRLAHALAKVSEHSAGLELGAVIDGLKQARWSLAQASENAGLAKYMGSAELAWLKGLRHEFSDVRKELRCLIHQYQEGTQESALAEDRTERP